MGLVEVRYLQREISITSQEFGSKLADDLNPPARCEICPLDFLLILSYNQLDLHRAIFTLSTSTCQPIALVMKLNYYFPTSSGIELKYFANA